MSNLRVEKKKLGLAQSRGKKYVAAFKLADRKNVHALDSGLDALLKSCFAKFDETIEVAFNLGVDPKHADQMIRGAMVLPHGLGKTARVAVMAKGDKAKEALAAGADIVGAEDLIEKIQAGVLDFDRLIATPDMMVQVSKVGKILGPRDLMPNPKLGTVTMDVAKAVGDQKKGKVEYRTEKTGIIHVRIGKKSFGAQKLKENFLAIAGTLMRAKPATSKGTYLKKVSLSATMSPVVILDVADVSAQSLGK